MSVIANIGYAGYRLSRILMHGGDRRILGTEGPLSDMPNYRLCRSRICRILLYNDLCIDYTSMMPRIDLA